MLASVLLMPCVIMVVMYLRMSLNMFKMSGALFEPTFWRHISAIQTNRPRLFNLGCGTGEQAMPITPVL